MTSSSSPNRCPAMGFFVEALEQQRSDRKRFIAPLLARHLGESPVVEEDRGAETVEDAVEDLRGLLPQLARGDPARAGRRRGPRDADREAQGPGRRRHAHRRLGARRPDAGGARPSSRRWRRPTAKAPSPSRPRSARSPRAARRRRRPHLQLSAETQRLLATDANRLDAELMEIFLIEATEVLDKVLENRAELERNLGDREALRSARRQFHTIKGSGRMVGLDELGELAYDVEKIHNRLLEEERDVTPAMLQSPRRRRGELPPLGGGAAGQGRRLCRSGRALRRHRPRRSGIAVRIRVRRAPGDGAPPRSSRPCRRLRRSRQSPSPPPHPKRTLRSKSRCPPPISSRNPSRSWPHRCVRNLSHGSSRPRRTKTPAPRSSNSRPSARCLPASRWTTARRRRPTSSRSAKFRCPRISMPSSSTRRAVISRRSSTSSRCCSSIRGTCRPGKWSGQATRCAAFIAPAAFR